MSWIHRDDLAGMFVWLLENERTQGVYSGTAPNPVTNRDLSRPLGRVLHRPAILPAPGFAADRPR